MAGQASSLALADVVVNSSRVEIDTSRPFRSVKEAVAIFGERFLLGGAGADACYRARSSDQLSAAGGKPIYSLPAPPPKPQVAGLRSASSSPPSFASQTFVQRGDDDLALLNSLKKLELELEDTKRELEQLKEKEAETEMTVAGLSAQLQKSMSLLAEIESAKGADMISPADAEEQQPYGAVGKIRSDRWRDERMRELEYLPTLAQALSVGEMEDGGCDVTRLPKRKPIIPLIGDIFSCCMKNKGSSTDLLISRSFYVGRPSFYSVIR